MYAIRFSFLWKFVILGETARGSAKTEEKVERSEGMRVKRESASIKRRSATINLRPNCECRVRVHVRGKGQNQPIEETAKTNDTRESKKRALVDGHEKYNYSRLMKAHRRRWKEDQESPGHNMAWKGVGETHIGKAKTNISHRRLKGQPDERDERNMQATSRTRGPPNVTQRVIHSQLRERDEQHLRVAKSPTKEARLEESLRHTGRNACAEADETLKFLQLNG
ncbi:hypothetical protein EV361DRAFT_1021685 [Lentinula raphanica]|nr:hypothetical protein EV361DRAFT_1021685 [Lentinula raphanica]